MRKGLPPFLMVCGSEDKINYDAAVKVCPELRAMGNSCDLFTVKGGIHGVINWEKEADQRDAYKVYLTEWLRKTLAERPITGRRRS